MLWCLISKLSRVKLQNKVNLSLEQAV
jgi:hypothetical protein